MNIVVDKLLVNYRDEGHGKTVLMLHGWGSTLNVYDMLTRDLVPSYRVVRLDLPGFGASQQPPLTWGVDKYADFVVAFAAKLGIDPYGLVGHSFGGQTAVNIVGRGLIKPDRLVLIAASAVRPAPGGRERLFGSIAKVGKATIGRTPLGTAMRNKLYLAAGTTDYLQSGPMKPIYRRIITEDQTGLARHIACPALLVWGSLDSDAPVARGKILHDCIAGSKLEVFPDAGHFVLLDRPHEVTKLVKAFL